MEEVKKGKRGRPSKGSEEFAENSTSTIIKDPLIEPFFIQKDRNNFTVFEVSIPERGFAGKKSSGKEMEKFVGHYTCFENALKVISKRKFYQNKQEYNSIKEYINDWKVLKNEIETLFTKIEI
jgi:hypothetical protein